MLLCRGTPDVLIEKTVFKKCAIALGFGTALLLSMQAHAATLADTVSASVATHPTMAAGKAAVEAAARAVREQESGFFPTIGVNGSAGRQNANNDTTRAATGNDATSWVGQGNVTVTQPLFAGFSTLNRTRAAAARRDSAKHELEGTGEEIGLRAARAHLNLMRTKELLDLARAYSEEIRKRHDRIELMVREGAADEAEQLQASEIMLAANNTRLGYEEAWQQAEADYIEIAGAPPSGALEFGPPTWDALIPATVDEAVQAALANNPRLHAATRLAAAMGREAAAARGGLSPRVEATASYDQKDQKEELGGEVEDASAMLRVSWNFSTGGAEFARIGRSVAEFEQAAARRAQAARDAEHDARQKFNSMKIVDEQFRVLAAREGETRKILDSFLKQFEAGKQSNLQLIGANAKLFEAQASRTDAYYRRLLARFELLGVMGRLREAFTAPPAPAKAEPVREETPPPPPPPAARKAPPPSTGVLEKPLPWGYSSGRKKKQE